MSSPLDARDLRNRAARVRRVASIRTYGDSVIDRELSALADKLERDAERLEGKTRAEAHSAR